MIWYKLIACFFTGVFFTNAVPHFVHGVSGDRFPTPFAKPPGRGLSSPFLNVIWALINLVAGTLCAYGAGLPEVPAVGIVVLFAGIAAMAMRLSYALSKMRDGKNSTIG